MREYFKLYFNGKAHHTHGTSLSSSDALFFSSSTQLHSFSNWRTARPIQFDVTKLTHSDKLKCCNKSDDVCCSTNALLGWRRLIQVWQSKDLIKKIKMMKEWKNIQRQIDLTVLFLLLLWPEERKKKTTETPHTVYLHVALEKATVK